MLDDTYAFCHQPAAVMAQGQGLQWVGTWAAVPQATAPLESGWTPPIAEGFSNQTIRNIVQTSLGGRAALVRLTNAYGLQPVTFNVVYIGLVESCARIVPEWQLRRKLSGHEPDESRCSTK